MGATVIVSRPDDPMSLAVNDIGHRRMYDILQRVLWRYRHNSHLPSAGLCRIAEQNSGFLWISREAVWHNQSASRHGLGDDRQLWTVRLHRSQIRKAEQTAFSLAAGILCYETMATPNRPRRLVMLAAKMCSRLLIVALSAFFCTAVTAEPLADKDLQPKLEQLANQFMVDWQKQDTAALSAVLAPDFLFAGPRGFKTRSETLDALRVGLESHA
jgi:hypothetical protein